MIIENQDTRDRCAQMSPVTSESAELRITTSAEELTRATPSTGFQPVGQPGAKMAVLQHVGGFSTARRKGRLS
jgi:hypothetical protein